MKLKKEEIFETLDKIEACTSLPGRNGHADEIGMLGVDGEALNLMYKLVRIKDGLRLAVERYSASNSLIIVNALTAVLVKRAQNTKLKNAHLLFEFIEKLQRLDKYNVLATVQTAIKFQIGIAQVWQHAQMPESLYPFLQYCLEFTGEKANWIHPPWSKDVQDNAIDILRTMCAHNIYTSNFAENQRHWLEEKVKEIAGAHPADDLLQKSVAWFFDCLGK